MSIFNPQGGILKIFVKGLGEVEVNAGGLDPEWERRFMEDGYEGEDDEDEVPFVRGQKCPHCGQSIA
jgi:hypothetical protein